MQFVTDLKLLYYPSPPVNIKLTYSFLGTANSCAVGLVQALNSQWKNKLLTTIFVFIHHPVQRVLRLVKRLMDATT
jgi:hypothetical protein